MKYLFTIGLLLLIIACNSETANTPESASSESVETNPGYIYSNISGTTAQQATLKDAAGLVNEIGYIDNGKKTGMWTYYNGESRLPIKVINYVNGQYHGVYLEFNERGQINLRAEYKNNKLHGTWAKYRFGRAEEEAEYAHGELNGVYKKYTTREGKIQSETTYKNGVQHGPYRFYNENGEVTLEYEYKNGEKVSGGMVDPGKENKPK